MQLGSPCVTVWTGSQFKMRFICGTITTLDGWIDPWEHGQLWAAFGELSETWEELQKTDFLFTARQNVQKSFILFRFCDTILNMRLARDYRLTSESLTEVHLFKFMSRKMCCVIGRLVMKNIDLKLRSVAAL